MEIENIPSILIDNKTGIKKIMSHLYENHKIKKFAFIKGPEENIDAKERFEAFLEFINENNLELKKDFILQGDFRFESGRDAVKNLGEKIKDIEAIVCANDNMAIGALNYLNENNISNSVKITGFDNIISSEGTLPPLTTVDINLKQMCEKAVTLILELINGKDVPEKTFIEPRLIIRNSCGCKTEKVKSEIDKTKSEKIKNAFQDFLNSNFNKDSSEIIELITEEKINFKDISDLIEEKNVFDFIDYLISQTRFFEKNRLNSFYNEILMLRILTRDISGDISIEELKKHLIEKLILLNIKDFFLYLFKEKIINYNEKEIGNIYPELAIKNNAVIPLENLKISTINDGNYIFLPLSGKNELYGFIIINYIENDIIYEILREQLSNTLKYIYVLNEKIETEKKLEETLINLKNLSEKYYSMLEYLPSAIFEIDNNFSIEFLNKNAKELLLLSDNEKNLNFIDFILPEDRIKFNEIYKKIKNGEKVTELKELRLIKRSGAIIHFLFNILPIVKEKQITGIRISGFDIRPILSKSFSLDENFFKEFKLSPREQEVLKLWLQGYQIKEIASTLFIAESTVKIHIGSIYSKLGVKNKTEFFEFIKEYQIKTFGYESFVFSILSQLIKE